MEGKHHRLISYKKLYFIHLKQNSKLNIFQTHVRRYKNSLLFTALRGVPYGSFYNLMFLWPCIMNWPHKTTNVMTKILHFLWL